MPTATAYQQHVCAPHDPSIDFSVRTDAAAQFRRDSDGWALHSALRLVGQMHLNRLMLALGTRPRVGDPPPTQCGICPANDRGC